MNLLLIAKAKKQIYKIINEENKLKNSIPDFEEDSNNLESYLEKIANIKSNLKELHSSAYEIFETKKDNPELNSKKEEENRLFEEISSSLDDKENNLQFSFFKGIEHDFIKDYQISFLKKVENNDLEYIEKCYFQLYEIAKKFINSDVLILIGLYQFYKNEFTHNRRGETLPDDQITLLDFTANNFFINISSAEYELLRSIFESNDTHLRIFYNIIERDRIFSESQNIESGQFESSEPESSEPESSETHCISIMAL